jgi:superfamily II DNA or RNA helicase
MRATRLNVPAIPESDMRQLELAADPVNGTATALTALLRTLPSDPYRRGLAFERICQWFLINDPIYAMQLKHVWLWNEWPERWGPDSGIDLVAETTVGDLWAIQAKAYDPEYSITKHDVDTFLSESGRPCFIYRLLIATTGKFSPAALRTLDAQAVPAGRLSRSQLEKADVRWPRSADELRPGRPEPKRPLPHVREAIDAVCERFETSSRGQLIMACGTGKTLTGLWVSERLGCRRTLVLVPSLTLLAQTLREWSVSATGPLASLAVCSDPTVASDDDLIEHTSDLGIPVTTDPAVIAQFLRRDDHQMVVFATYQSSGRLTKNELGDVPPFDLAIADEAHRCVGVAAGVFATILDEGKIAARRRLFMTATPRIFTRQPSQGRMPTGVEIASMDNHHMFGLVFYRLSFAEAIDRRLLSDYQVAIICVRDADYRAQAQAAALVSIDGGTTVTDARTLAGQVGLAKAMARYGLRRVISFHSRVALARAFSRSFPSAVAWMPTDHRPSGTLWSRYISGQMPSGERDRDLTRFRELAPDERGLLANARCLSEGVDVPAIDGVAFIDPRRSAVDIVQAVGRAIRRAEDKTTGTIILPVLIDPDADPEEALSSSAFQPVWDVLRALRAHDDVLAKQLDGLRRELGHKKPPDLRLPAKIHIDVSAGIGLGFADACTVRLVEQTTASWEFWYGLLERYGELHGNAAVPAPHIESGFALGRWIANQRHEHSRDRLDAERARRLEMLPGWSWSMLDKMWEEGYRRLSRYSQRHDTARVPTEYAEDGFNLGRWVVTVRRARKAGELASERITALERLPRWTWDTADARWEDNFAQLAAYVKRVGHARVPQSHVEDGVGLGTWVSRQREVYRNGELPAGRAARLAALDGWNWDPATGYWARGLTALESFVAREGHPRVPQNHHEEGFDLGSWVSRQRDSFGRGKLAAERAAQLEGVDDWSWDLAAGDWDRGFAVLETFVAREGHAQVPAKHEENGYKLGNWVRVQRRRYAEDNIGRDQESRLERQPGWSWAPQQDVWERGLAALQVFVGSQGHARVPAASTVDGFRLGRWVGHQRVLFGQGKLPANRARQLEQFPLWSWDLKRDAWLHGFRLLQKYVAEHGNSRVPYSHTEGDFPLGAWVYQRRWEYHRGRLDKEKEEQLIQLPEWDWEIGERVDHG